MQQVLRDNYDVFSDAGEIRLYPELPNFKRDDQHGNESVYANNYQDESRRPPSHRNVTELPAVQVNSLKDIKRVNLSKTNL